MMVPGGLCSRKGCQAKDLQKFYKLWYYKEGMDSAMLLVDKNSRDETGDDDQ